MKKWICLVMAALLFAGGKTYIDYRERSKFTPASGLYQAKEIDNFIKKINVSESIVKEMTQNRELITLEVSLEEEIQIDESWGSWGLFRKEKAIQFTGTGVFVVQLDGSEEIHFNHGKRTASVMIQKPVLKMISLSEENTMFEKTQNGLLRFGNIKITPEQSNAMLQTVKDAMAQKMYDETVYTKACESSEESVASLFQDIMKENGMDYQVEVTIIEL